MAYKPSIFMQEKDASEGMLGQFIVQYDVDMSGTDGNEIQVLDGYFVHHFAPEGLQVLPRYVVFVVDISGSMEGIKLKQTKDAMVTVLGEMSEQDSFDIITFSSRFSIWQSRVGKQMPQQVQDLCRVSSDVCRHVCLILIIYLLISFINVTSGYIKQDFLF